MDLHSPEANPYQASSTVDTTSVAEVPRGWFQQVRWPAVFALNLIVPLMLATNFVPEKGNVGLASAIVVLYLAGWLFCRLGPECERSLIRGGALIALTQLFPILQVLAGLLAFGIMASLGAAVDADNANFGIQRERDAFAITMMVGLMLMSLAAGLGVLVATIQALFGGRLSSANTVGDRSPDRAGLVSEASVESGSSSEPGVPREGT